jgi:hypothetical protein
MATSKIPTFEEVDKHIQSADLAAIQPGGKHYPAAAAAGAAAVPNICPAYKTVRPILLLLAETPLIPARWREAIKAFVGVLDVICP